MNVVILMLAVTACYTICSLNDKYAAAKANFSGDEFTFLMCSSMSVFLALSLPFQNLSFSLTWQSFLAVLLVVVCKMLEFQMSARVLKQLSAFELKACSVCRYFKRNKRQQLILNYKHSRFRQNGKIYYVIDREFYRDLDFKNTEYDFKTLQFKY